MPLVHLNIKGSENQFTVFINGQDCQMIFL